MQKYKKGLVDKSDISGFLDSSDLEKKIATSVTKTELKSEPDKIKNLKKSSSYSVVKVFLKIM